VTQIHKPLETVCVEAHHETVLVDVRDATAPWPRLRGIQSLQVFQRQPAFRLLRGAAYALQAALQCVEFLLVAQVRHLARSSALICRWTRKSRYLRSGEVQFV
jgi:hypothetical protein